jgi:GH24 family phage-related lysozyme (muramidase)
MKNIATILKSNIDLGEKVDKITTQFLAMQRVWPSDDPQSGHPGLRRRRRAEAALFKKG